MSDGMLTALVYGVVALLVTTASGLATLDLKRRLDHPTSMSLWDHASKSIVTRAT
jgi:hypothetical protein